MLSSFTKTEILSNLVVDLFPAIKINYDLKISIFKIMQKPIQVSISKVS